MTTPASFLILESHDADVNAIDTSQQAVEGCIFDAEHTRSQLVAAVRAGIDGCSFAEIGWLTPRTLVATDIETCQPTFFHLFEMADLDGSGREVLVPAAYDTIVEDLWQHGDGMTDRVPAPAQELV